MFKKISLVVVVAIAALLLFAATRPDTFRVERTARIQAPAEKIFPLIDDFHRWSAWSPYEKLDPEMKRSFGGAPSGKGATYAWESNGASPYVAKLMGIFFNMDQMIGKDFEAGLANLKTVTEK
jgi:hypothetical protein